MQKKYSIVPFTISFLLLLFSGKVSAQCTDFFPADNPLDTICQSSIINFKVLCSGAASGTWSIESEVDVSPTISSQNAEECTITIGSASSASASFNLKYSPTSGADIVKSFTVSNTIDASTVSNQDIDDVCSGVAIDYPTPFDEAIVYYLEDLPGIALPDDREVASTDNIQETIINDTSSPINVIFTTTPIETSGFNECWGSTYTITATINPVPSADATITPTVLCEGETLYLDGSGSTGETQWSWKNGTTEIANSELFSKAVTTGDQGDYRLLVSNEYGCKDSTDAVTVTVNLLPDGHIFNTDTLVCEGSDFTLSATEIGSATYAWTLPDGASGPSTSSIDITDMSVSKAGKYYLLITENDCSVLDSVTVTLGTLPQAVAAALDSTLCEGQNLQLIGASDDADDRAYKWFKGANPTAISSMQNHDIMGVTTSDGATYIVEVTNTANGCKETGSVDIFVYANPDASGAFTPASVCIGSDAQLVGLPDGMTTYSWSGPMGFTSGQQDTTFTTNEVSDDAEYFLTVTDANGCMDTSEGVELMLNELPDISITTDDENVCEGNDLDIIGGPNSQGLHSYKWTYPDGSMMASKDVDEEANSANHNGRFYFEVTRDATGCTATDSVDINVITPDSGEIYTSDNTPCQGDDIELIARPNGTGFSFEWAVAGGAVYTVVNDSILDMDNIPLVNSGDYFLTVTSPQGCQSLSSLTLSVNANPVASASATDSQICVSDEIELLGNPSGMASYAWSGPDYSSNSQNPSSFTATSTDMAGTYSLLVTDSNGCTGENNVQIVVNSLPVLQDNQNSSICSGTAVNFDLSTLGTASNFTWIASSNDDIGGETTTEQTGNQITDVLYNTGNDASASVSYTVVGISSEGCLSPAVTVTINVQKLPEVDIESIDPNAEICGDINHQVSNVSASYYDALSWTVQSGAGGLLPLNVIDPVYSPLSSDIPGTVTLLLTATGDGACFNETATGVYNIAYSTAPEVSILDTPTDICVSGSYTFTNVTSDGGTRLWTTNGSGTFNNETLEEPTYTPGDSDAGTDVTLTLTITGEGSCEGQSSMASYILGVDPLPTIDAGTDVEVCEGDEVSIVATGTNINEATITWSENGTGSLSPTDAFATTYSSDINEGGSTVLATIQANGTDACSAETITDNLTITVNNNPTFTSAEPICSDDRLTVTLSGTYTEANNITISPDIGVVSFSGGNYTITGFPAETSYSITFENTITGCSTLFEGTPVNCPCEGEFAVDNPSLTTNLSSCYTGNASDNNTFNVTNAGTNEEVRWFNVNGDNPIFTGESFTPDNIDVGVYNYEVQIYNTQTNCGSERVTVTYTIHELPILTAEDEEICDGEVLTLTANVDNPVNPLSWNWSGGSGSIQNPNSQTTTVTGVTSNSVFTIEVTDGNSCSSLTNVNVLVNNVPTANIELVDDEVFEYCQGDPEDERPDIRILLTGGTPYSFVYKKDNSNITVDNHNSDEFIIENAEAGIYKLISVNNGCDGSVSDLNVEIIENVINPVTIQGADKVCENGTSILTATGDDYTNYEWSSGPNSADASSIEIALPNTYFVTVTNDKGCTAMDSKEVTLSKTVAAITPNVPSIDVCLGEEVTLQATNGGTNDSPNRYKWLGYENDTTFLFKTTPTESKIIKVEVQNSYQCKDTAQVSIVVNEAIEADITVTDYNICDKDTFFLNLNNKDEFVEASFGTFGQYTPATGVYSFVGTQDTTKIVVSTVDNNGCEAEVEVNNLVRYELPFMAADEDEINVAVSESATFVISSFEIDERCDSDYGFTWFVDKKNGTNGVLDSDYETITTDDVSQLVIPADGTAGDTWEIFAVLNDACTCESSDTLRFILNIEKSSDCSIKFVGKQSKACVGEKVTLKAEGKSKFEFKDAFWSISYKDESGVETEISVNENSDNDNEFWQILTYTASSVAGSDNNSNGEFTFVCKKSGTYRAGYNLIHNDCETSKSSKVTVYDNPVMDVPLGAFPDTICYGDVINATLQFPEGDFNYKLDYTVNGDLFKGYVFDKNNKDLKLGKQTDKEVKINFNSLTSIYAGNFTCTLDDLNDLNVKVSVRDSFSYLIETDCDNDSISYQVYLFGGQKPYNVNVTLPGSTNADTYSIFTSSYFTDYNPVGEYFIGANSQCEESLDIKKFNEECIQCVPIESAVPSASLPEEDILVCTNKPYDVVIENINTDLKDIKYLVVLQKLNTSLVFNQSSVEKELNYQFNENNIELTIDYEELKDIVDVSPNIKYRIVIYPLPSVSGVYKEAPCEGAGFNISFTKPPSPTINATDLIVCKNQSNVILSHNAQNGTWFKDDSFTGEVNDFDTDDLYLNFTNVNFNDKFNFVLEETLGGCTGSDTISIRVSENENDVAPEVKNIYRYPGGIFVYDEEDLCYTWGVNNRSVGDFPEEVLHNRYFLFSNAIKDVPYNEDTHKVWVEVQYPEGADCNACTNRIYFNVLTPPKLGQNPFDSYAVKAFPNPVSDNLVIDIKGVHLGEFTIELWNTTGQMIEHKNVNKDEHTVRYDYDMSIHVPGLYLLKVIDENGFSNILKVVKQ